MLRPSSVIRYCTCINSTVWLYEFCMYLMRPERPKLASRASKWFINWVVKALLHAFVCMFQIVPVQNVHTMMNSTCCITLLCWHRSHFTSMCNPLGCYGDDDVYCNLDSLNVDIHVETNGCDLEFHHQDQDSRLSYCLHDVYYSVQRRTPFMTSYVIVPV